MPAPRVRTASQDDSLPVLGSGRVADSGLGMGLALTDPSERRIRYLRVSVTDRCNYRCAYCMPAEGWAKKPREALLTLEEIGRFVELMASLGVTRVRLTGGEPLLRRGLVELVRRVSETPGIDEVVMTTNGHLLSRHAGALFQAGLTGLNVSLDTLDAERFSRMSRGGDLEVVKRGLTAAREAGFVNIKLNTVVVAGENDHELAELCRFAFDEGHLPRFIELMPIGQLDYGRPEQVVPTASMLERLGRAFGLEASTNLSGRVRGPARYHRVVSGPYLGAEIGLISPMTDDGFCASCNRARLTSTGGFRPCLGNDDEVSVLYSLRNHASAEHIVALVRQAVALKLPAHRMQTFATAPSTGMTALGG